ncbi:MAG: ABC transporter permease [Bacteroidales bacterium]|nr:ABC transporter permease [Bacteroidales bacterium]
MTFESFIAKRFLPRDLGTYAGPLVSIATYSIALGVLVMVMSVCILRGFQGQIRQKVVGFGSHIVVTTYATGNAYEETPISTLRPEVSRIRNTPGIRHLSFFANKGAMIKTEDQIHGIIFKGVDSGYDSTFFASNLVEGKLFNFPVDKPSNQVIISQTVANKLHLTVGDKLRTYFWQNDNYRARAFQVSGIYSTDLSEFDEHYVVGDLRQVQNLNDWDSTQVAGYEILVDDFKHLDPIADNVIQQLGYDLTLATIVQQNPALFSWLDLLDSNIALIIAIMMLVCTVSIISALLIMIFEKTSTIGVLKALGATDRSVRKIFLLKSASIIGKGIVLGDALALLLGWIQHHYHIVHLDSTSYSMDTVPIDLNPWIFIAISTATLAICLLALLLPTAYISRIEPAKTIKFD